MDVAINAPPEIAAAFEDAHRSPSGWIDAYCPMCDPERRKRGKRTLRAGIVHGRPWWGCMRCHCEKGFAAAKRTARLRMTFDKETADFQDARNRAYAMEMIDAATFVRPGDPIDRYLRQTRGLAPIGRDWSTDIRVASRRHSCYPRTKAEGPVMVAVVRDAGGTAVACHRTYLHVLPDGRVVKVDDPSVPPPFHQVKPKRALAPIMGCAVRLGDESEEIGVAEGIETALGFAQATGLACWASISASGMEGLVVPASVRRLVIGPDLGDTHGTGLAAAWALRRRILDTHARVEVDIRLPPAGCDDWGEAPLAGKDHQR